MASKIASNTGPVIHLGEIDLAEAFKIFKNIIIPEEVEKEIRKYKTKLPTGFKVKKLDPKSKDISRIFSDKFDLDLGESQAIALVIQEKARLFLTDDLDARTVANMYNIEVHGSIGIILRAFRDKIINKSKTIEKLNEVYEKSSLFITKDLIEKAIDSVKAFKK